MRYPLAPNAIWFAVLGEGHLRGFSSSFLRLAGCSVGCPQCDTDYTVAMKLDVERIADRVDRVTPPELNDRWVWITGGEPADHNLMPLLKALRARRFSIAVATSGHKRLIPPVDWLSVSPHDITKMVQPYGNEVKLVDGLNGLDISTLTAGDLYPRFAGFMYKYVQPLWDDSIGGECPDSVRRCVEFQRRFPNWSLSRQDHKHWGVA